MNLLNRNIFNALGYAKICLGKYSEWMTSPVMLYAFTYVASSGGRV